MSSSEAQAALWTSFKLFSAEHQFNMTSHDPRNVTHSACKTLTLTFLINLFMFAPKKCKVTIAPVWVPPVLGLVYDIGEGCIRNSTNAAVCRQGGTTFSAGVERCSLSTITSLKVTENNDCRDEEEAMIFDGEPTKTAVPIPFTKELSSCQMMRANELHFPFFSLFAAVSEMFLHLKVCILQSLNSCRSLILFLQGR